MNRSAKETMAWAFKEMRLEFGREVSGDDMIVAAYWWFNDHHKGQWSMEYECLCVLGQVYSPGPLTNGPESDTMESMCYDLLCHMDSCDH